MSLSDTRVLPALYDALATPPLSPSIGAHPHTTSRPTPLQSPFSSASPSPVSLSPTRPAPIPSRPTTTPPSPPSFEPLILDSVPRSLLPTQFILPPKPLIRYPTPLYVDTTTDSLTREKKGKMPALSHLLSVGKGRVLALAACERFVYAGCQSTDNEIVVFSRTSLQPVYRLLGHGGSVLALMVVKEKGWLVSSSSAGDIRIWCTTNLEPLYIIHPCDDTAGDIYSLAWDHREGGTLYFGSQGATIEWINFSETSPHRQRKPSLSSTNVSVTIPLATGSSSANGIREPMSPTPPTPSQRTGRYRPHHFFDNPPSKIPSGASTPRCSVPGSAASGPASHKHLLSGNEIERLHIQGPPTNHHVDELEVRVEDRMSFAHYGYVYALHMTIRPDGSRWLISGSGDSDVKIWQCLPGGGLHHLRNFSGLTGAVLSFAVRDSLLFAGLQDGEIVVWDLETGACIRTIEAHDSDVLTMAVLGSEVYTAAADGRVIRVNEEFDATAAFRAHSGIILSSTIVEGTKDGWELITAGNDSYVKIWAIDMPQSPHHDTEVAVEGEGDVMLYALSKLVAVPTVSDEAHRESCRQGAHLLKKILSQLGAQAQVLSGEQGRNPLVLATFSGRDSDKPRKRVLFYGHYDVQPAEEEYWETNPWELSGRNGYLYGRGVSDNKGPILAVACAAATLRQRRELDVDLVLLIEGEEEAGSRGFASTVRKHKADIGHIDTVLLSNSTWIDENDPCVVFGMRGVVYANLSVSTARDDAHSGVDGGAVAEPMFDIVRVLGAITDANGVKLPGFYDDVSPSTPEEMQLLEDVAKACGRSVDDLVKVWRHPSFSIANISSSGASNKTVIPKKVTADISMRIVPDQDLKAIVDSLKTFCHETFAGLNSPNHFEIAVTHSASWWLTSLDSPYFKALESAVKDVWGVPPLKIREGGTVPTIFWLEQEFQAPCVHLPLGQASDAGHLANERMRLLNLRNGKRVVEAFLTKLSAL